MRLNPYSGRFIVVEGLDGSGQSTQADLLRKFLIKKGCKVILTKEPTLDSEAGKKLRRILDKKRKISPKKLQELFAKDREIHLKKVIIPALKEGKIVISDRYFFSSFAYGQATGVNLDWLIKLNNEFLLPDLTFIFKVSPRICLQRIKKRNRKRTLFEEKKKLTEVWKNYKILPKRFSAYAPLELRRIRRSFSEGGKNIYIINGEKPIPKVFEEIKTTTISKIQFMKEARIAKLIDHTNIEITATEKDIIKTCQEAKRYGFRAVCVRPKWVKLTKKELKDTNIDVIVLIDPPIGDSPHKKRVKICEIAKINGADELDVVISIPDVKHERWEKVLNDLKEICKILPTKVIIGSGYLTDEEIEKTSKITKEAGAICVKTATEKDPLEQRELKEKLYHLKIMKKAAPGLLIKASGNIKTLKDVKEAIKAGADIIGTSSGVKIMKEIKK